MLYKTHYLSKIKKNATKNDNKGFSFLYIVIYEKR
jgi:hypothetical protein